MSPHQVRGRERSLTGAHGARAAHGARENRAPPIVISGTEFMQGMFTAIKQVVRNTVHEMLVPARAVDTRAVIKEGVNETKRITHPKSQCEVHTKEEHSGSFGSEGSEDSRTGLRYDISSGPSETTGQQEQQLDASICMDGWEVK
ncbi:hypothetical protein Acr_17g0007530 [Actinidia rufa]|uniref:Uncharacterized protein n=1 Tax=Actinidia rufa TaxID=165716 RepID=A0A7J0G332_9ERIC|nr:hypothetical protein Acr_17g0007530 [Actinidia rufa]